jgi:hypothetical protein
MKHELWLSDPEKVGRLQVALALCSLLIEIDGWVRGTSKISTVAFQAILPSLPPSLRLTARVTVVGIRHGIETVSTYLDPKSRCSH